MESFDQFSFILNHILEYSYDLFMKTQPAGLSLGDLVNKKDKFLFLNIIFLLTTVSHGKCMDNINYYYYCIWNSFGYLK